MRGKMKIIRLKTSLLVIIYLLLNTAFAETSIPVALPSGYGNGYNNVYNGKGAFEREFIFLDGSKVMAFSLVFNESIDMGKDNMFALSPYDVITDINIKKIGFIAKNINTLGKPMPDSNSESVARQLAIWSLSNSIELNKFADLNYPIMKRAEEIITLSGGREYNSEGTIISAEVTVDKKKKLIKIVYKDKGVILKNQEIIINIISNNYQKLNLVTDSNGMVNLKYNTDNIEFESILPIKVPSGALLIPNNGGSVITFTESYIKNIISFELNDLMNNKKIATIIKKPPKIDKDIISIKKINDLETIKAITSEEFKVLDVSDSLEFERRHIIDSINYQIGNIIDVKPESKLLVIGSDKEKIKEVSDYLLLKKYPEIYIYEGDYNTIFEKIEEKYFITNIINEGDPSNEIILFKNEILEPSPGSDDENNPILFLLGIVLLLISIFAAYVRLKTSKK